MDSIPDENQQKQTYGRNENLSYMVMLSVLNNPVLTLQLGILGKLLGLMGRIVKRCVMEVSLAQVSCILMYVYVAPPTPVGAWSMALGLRQRFEYYYYYTPCITGTAKGVLFPVIECTITPVGPALTETRNPARMSTTAELNGSLVTILACSDAIQKAHSAQKCIMAESILPGAVRTKQREGSLHVRTTCARTP